MEFNSANSVLSPGQRLRGQGVIITRHTHYHRLILHVDLNSPIYHHYMCYLGLVPCEQQSQGDNVKLLLNRNLSNIVALVLFVTKDHFLGIVKLIILQSTASTFLMMPRRHIRTV